MGAKKKGNVVTENIEDDDEGPSASGAQQMLNGDSSKPRVQSSFNKSILTSARRKDVYGRDSSEPRIFRVVDVAASMDDQSAIESSKRLLLNVNNDNGGGVLASSKSPLRAATSRQNYLNDGFSKTEARPSNNLQNAGDLSARLI